MLSRAGCAGGSLAEPRGLTGLVCWDQLVGEGQTEGSSGINLCLSQILGEHPYTEDCPRSSGTRWLVIVIDSICLLESGSGEKDGG